MYIFKLTICHASFTMFYENIRSDLSFNKLLNRPNLCTLWSKNDKQSGKFAEKSWKNGTKKKSRKSHEKTNTVFCGYPDHKFLASEISKKED